MFDIRLTGVPGARQRSTALAMVILVALGSLAACGGSDDSAASSDSSDVTDSDAKSDRSSRSDRSDDSSSERSKSRSSSSDEGSGGSVDTDIPPATGKGTAFVDPLGFYELEIGKDWTELTGVSGVTAWQVGAATGGFAPNVNVVTQAAPPGADFDSFVDSAFDGAEIVLTNFEVVDQAEIEGADGDPLALAEYTAEQQGTALHFLAVLDLGPTHGAVATFTATEAQFDGLVAEVQSFVETLEAK